MGALPDAVARREQTFAALTARFARALPEELRFLAFTAPTSFREPEIDDAWHPFALERGFLPSIVAELPALARACVGGARRFLLGRFGACTILARPGAHVLIVTPASTCTRVGDRITTTYVHADDVDRVHWLVFDDAARSTYRPSVDRVRYLAVLARLLVAWMLAGRVPHAEIRDTVVGRILLVRWVLHGHWATLLTYALQLTGALRELQPQLVSCVHEVWPHARVLWSVARRMGVRTATVQHASIRRTKLWYFPHAEELRAGYATPEIFAVFSAHDRVLLAPSFPSGTQFPIACSPRYAPWKDHVFNAENAMGASEVLFVSSIPWWDVLVMVEAIEHLLASGSPRARVVVRLHPAAKPLRRSMHALTAMERRGEVAFALGSLANSLERAAVIIGMNTTVLEEAAFLGRAVVVLTTDRFLSFAPSLGVSCAAASLTWDALDDACRRCAVTRASLQRDAREALGLDAPTYRLTASADSTGGAQSGMLRGAS